MEASAVPSPLVATSGTYNSTQLELKRRLEEHCSTIFGNGTSIDSLSVMEDGHAGLTFGIQVNANYAPDRQFILKMGPTGVRRSGSTDIFRQARLLRGLKSANLAVPSVLYASSDDGMIGAPFIIMERLRGRTFIIWEPDSSFLDVPCGLPSLWSQAVGVLTTLHRFDWQSHLRDWEAPTTLSDELDRWSALLRHTENPEWLELALQLRELLAARQPEKACIGVVHGDFQPGNIVYHAGCMQGVIDWDLAMLGPQGIDVGWLMMMADRNAWAEGWKPVAPLSPKEILECYIAGGGPAATDAEWYQSFAHFRMGAIAGLNLKLHRSGRRIDTTWERFAPSIPLLLTRGIELAQSTKPWRRSL